MGRTISRSLVCLNTFLANKFIKTIIPKKNGTTILAGIPFDADL